MLQSAIHPTEATTDAHLFVYIDFFHTITRLVIRKAVAVFQFLL